MYPEYLMRAHITPCEYPEYPMRASVLAEQCVLGARRCDDQHCYRRSSRVQTQRQPPAAAMRTMRPDRESSVDRHDVRTQDHRTVWTVRYICSGQRAPSSGVRAGHARARVGVRGRVCVFE
jgi:hypothetical protein